MSQNRLRLTLFIIWLAVFCILAMTMLLAPWIRHDELIGADQISLALNRLASFFVPPLSFFAACWFPHGPRVRAGKIACSREQTLAAICLTGVGMVFLSVVLIVALFSRDYAALKDVEVVPPGAAFEDRIDGAIRFALLLSPVILAPVAWITGHESTANRAKGERRGKPRRGDPADER